MEEQNDEKLNETINWLLGYVDAVTVSDYITKKHMEKMINRIASDLNFTDPMAPEEVDDLPF